MSEISKFCKGSFDYDRYNPERGNDIEIKTRILDLYNEKYESIQELAQAMQIPANEIYLVCQDKRNINENFIAGALRAFPEYHISDLF